MKFITKNSSHSTLNMVIKKNM